MRARVLLLAAALVTAADMAAEAQIRVPPTTVRRLPARRRPPRNFAAVNVGYQDIKPFVQTQTFDQYFEQGTFELNRKLAQPIFYDATVGVEVWRRLQVMTAFSFLTNTGPSDLTASVPHPLQFNRPRSTSGEVARVQRREIGYHFGAGWRVTTVPSLDFTVFAGPSIFAVDQVMVTALAITLAQETFPFDTLAFPSVNTNSITETAFGYHAGVDTTWRFTRRFGVGLLLRYSNARKDFAATAGGPITEIDIGGLHAGGGLRVNF
jgi:hypothetical protein